MKNIKVPGAGCHRREIIARAIAEVAKEAGVVTTLKKITDIARIVVDGQVMHASCIPDRIGCAPGCGSTRTDHRPAADHPAACRSHPDPGVLRFGARLLVTAHAQPTFNLIT